MFFKVKVLINFPTRQNLAMSDLLTSFCLHGRRSKPILVCSLLQFRQQEEGNKVLESGSLRKSDIV